MIEVLFITNVDKTIMRKTISYEEYHAIIVTKVIVIKTVKYSIEETHYVSNSEDSEISFFAIVLEEMD